MVAKMLVLPIIIPLSAALLSFAIRERFRRVQAAISLSAALLNLLVALKLFKTSFEFVLPWAGFGIEFSLKSQHFSNFIVLASAGFAFLVCLYSVAFLQYRKTYKLFFAFLLLAVSFTNGAALADNLLVLLFFWEGLLLALFGMIAIGNKGAFKTAIKAFIIVGISDLCMMLGVALTGSLAGTLTISKINLPLDGLGSIAFTLLMIGAISKAGAMPFHSWIPDAAIDAPLPFMALVPAALEKLLGIYFLARLSLEMFRLTPASWVSIMLMIIGVITIVLAVMMALIQKDYKKLLSYHAISQVGYMILGIGTAVPAGIVGGLFHMLNNALYKSGLFLSAGAVEKQAGTTDLEKLGGLGKKMPLTFICFCICAASISGVPPFNGFFSKELLYDGALQRGWIFYALACAGSFFTAASFLKLGHAAFLGKLGPDKEKLKEVAAPMLFPMVVIAFLCVIFGVFNFLPLNIFIQPILGSERLGAHNFSGFPADLKLVAVTIAVLLAALLNHYFGVKTKGSALKAVDHIHYALGLSAIYALAEKRFFDPYNLGLKIARRVGKIAFCWDRKINWLYDCFIVNLTFALSGQIRRWHTGNYSTYLVWSLIGSCIITLFFVFSL
ncbi:MAG: proton-conducting transporter membrane subunit [Candidatus Omnitrophota bacterium]